MLLTKLLKRYQWFRAFTPYTPQSGLGIIEIFIAMGIMGFVVGTVSYVVPKILVNQDRIESISVRDGIATSIKRAVSPTNLFYSANAFSDIGNVALKACIDGNPSTICRTTDRANPLDFRLAYQRGGSPLIIAGTRAAPALYQRGGGLCAKNPNCDIDWDVTAYFSAVCPNNATFCGDADNIRFRYRVKNHPRKNQREIPPFPSDEEFNDPTRGFILIPIFKDFRGGGCPALSIATSILPTGAPVCSCQPGTIKKQTLPDGMPDCQVISPSQCNNLRQRLVGFDINMNPICVDRSMSCSMIATTATCNGWIRSVNLGSCRIIKSPTNKGGEKKEAVCDLNQHECCRPI